jgi:hypothetical protein
LCFLFSQGVGNIAFPWILQRTFPRIASAIRL